MVPKLDNGSTTVKYDSNLSSADLEFEVILISYLLRFNFSERLQVTSMLVTCVVLLVTRLRSGIHVPKSAGA